MLDQVAHGNGERRFRSPACMRPHCCERLRFCISEGVRHDGQSFEPLNSAGLTQLQKINRAADRGERAVTVSRYLVGAANLATFAEVPHLWGLLDNLSHFRR